MYEDKDFESAMLTALPSESATTSPDQEVIASIYRFLKPEHYQKQGNTVLRASLHFEAGLVLLLKAMFRKRIPIRFHLQGLLTSQWRFVMVTRL